MPQPSFKQIVMQIEESNGWSDEQLASKAGVHRTTISRLRTGSMTTPSYTLGDRLMKLWEKRPK